MALANRVIAITGAASGIGEAVAYTLAERGALLSITDLDQDKIDTLAATLHKVSGGKCMATALDVRDSDAVNAWILDTVKAFGQLDGAVNCAGVMSKAGATIAETTNEDFEQVLSINLRGAFYCLRAELGSMEEAGAIVNIASTGGLEALPTQGAYSASKHGIIGLTRTAAREAGDRSIRVNAIAPGIIDTPLLLSTPQSTSAGEKAYKQRVALHRPGRAAEIARLAAFLLSSEASFCTGGVYVADGGYMA